MASTGFNNPYFTQESGRAQGGYATPLTPAARQAPSAGEQAHIEGLYAAPAAGTRETGRMTYEDTVVKTAILFAVMLAVAVVSWIVTLGGVLAAQNAT